MGTPKNITVNHGVEVLSNFIFGALLTVLTKITKFSSHLSFEILLIEGANFNSIRFEAYSFTLCCELHRIVRRSICNKYKERIHTAFKVKQQQQQQNSIQLIF